MQGLTVTTEGGALVIRVPVKGVQGAPSATGKTLVIASTRGNQAVSVDGETVYVGVNVYRHRPQA